MRREFSKRVKVAAFERAKGRCEICAVKLATGAIHYDHRIPDNLGGEPTLENCSVLCRSCHGHKTAVEDIPKIAKAKRIHARHIGARQSRSPLPCGRNSPLKKKITGEVVPR